MQAHTKFASARKVFILSSPQKHFGNFLKMKILYFLKFGLKATILFFAILIIAIVIESYFFRTPGSGGMSVVFLVLLILMKPVFVLLSPFHFTTIFGNLSGVFYIFFFSFLYFLVIFSIVGGVLGVVVTRKKVRQK